MQPATIAWRLLLTRSTGSTTPSARPPSCLCHITDSSVTNSRTASSVQGLRGADAKTLVAGGDLPGHSGGCGRPIDHEARWQPDHERRDRLLRPAAHAGRPCSRTRDRAPQRSARRLSQDIRRTGSRIASAFDSRLGDDRRLVHEGCVRVPDTATRGRRETRSRSPRSAARSADMCEPGSITASCSTSAGSGSCSCRTVRMRKASFPRCSTG